MIEFKSFAATVKATESDDPNGEFEVILSTKAVDRDGESVAPGAFDPLPRSIPIYYHHDWQDGAMPVGKARPFYDGDVLKAAGVFAPTARAQELRALVQGDFVDSMSIGFTRSKREVVKGQKTVVKADLFEASFTPIPINTEALVLTAKAGARNSASDADRLQQIHDLATENGAMCTAAKALNPRPLRGDRKAVAGSFEQRSDELWETLSAAYPDADWVETLATFDDHVVVEIHGGTNDDRQFTIPYTFDGNDVTLGDPAEVEAVEDLTVTPKAKAPGDAAAPDGASADPAADEAQAARARIRLLTTAALT